MTEDFLGVTLHFASALPYDETIRKAVQKQRADYLGVSPLQKLVDDQVHREECQLVAFTHQPKEQCRFFVER